MSTIKKHLVNNVKHTIPTYKKLPPSSSSKAITVSKTDQISPLQKEGVYIQGKQIFKSGHNSSEPNERSEGEAKYVFKSSEVASVDKKSKGSQNVELVGYKVTSNEVKKPAPSWTPLGSELPPCKICGDKASGLHYGVYTCEACKAFFRRTLKRSNVDFQCTCSEEERKKGVEEPRKTTCPKCRYERCIKVGMSKDAIKIGRYTINRKRQNDREVGLLKQRESHGHSNSESSPSSATTGSPYSSGQSVSSPEELSTNINTLSLDESPATVAAKRMRANDDGILFRSLTNSIMISILDNQKGGPQPATEVSNSSEISPMEQLFMQPFQAQAPATTEPEVPPGVTFTPPESQFSLIQKGGNSNPFSVPAKGGNPPVQVSTKTTPGLPIPDGADTFQFSPQTVTNIIQEIDQSDVAVQNVLNTADQASVPAGSITLTVTNQNGSLITMDTTNNESSQIEALLQQPVELSPLPAIHQGSPKDILQTAIDTSNLQENPGFLSHHLDAVVPSLTNDLVPSPLTEETGYGCCEESTNEIDALKSHDQIKPISKELDIMTDIGDIYSGFEAGDGQLDLDYQLAQFDIYQEPIVSPGKGISMDEINSIISDLVKTAQELAMGVKKMSCEEIMKRHADYLEQYRLKLKLFGQMNISTEEYLEFYNQTGIDIDNRQQIIIEGLKYLEEALAKLVQFTKVIPGFSDLDINDQVNLIKSGRFIQDMIRSCGAGSCIPTGSKITTTPWQKEYHVDELYKVFPKEFLDMKSGYAVRVNKLGLTTEETALIRAVVVTTPDMCELKDRNAVEVIHNKMIACLCHLLAVRPSNKKPLTLCQVMDVLASLRQVSSLDHQVIRQLFDIWPVSSNHTLLKECVT